MTLSCWSHHGGLSVGPEPGNEGLPLELPGQVEEREAALDPSLLAELVLLDQSGDRANDLFQTARE